MARWVRFGVIAFLAIWAHAAARAQVVGALDVAGGVGRLDGPWTRESRFTPTLRYASPFGFAQTEGLAVERTGTIALRRASIVAAAASPAFSAGLLRLALSANAASDSATRERWSDATAQLSLSARVRASGVFLGGAMDRRAPSLVVGAWRAFSTAIVSVTSRSALGTSNIARVNTFQQVGWDSVYTDTGGWHQYQTTRTVTDTSMVARFMQSHLLEARVDWGVGRWTLHADVFRHTATDSVRARTLARGIATMRVTNAVALFASAGTTAGPFMRAAPMRFGTIGIRLSPAALLAPPLPAAVRPTAAAFAVTPISDGRYRVLLRVPSARTVELSGDFARWAPIAMHEISANLWEATLALTPGTYRVNVRVNGDAWTPPPGLPAVDDEFNGRVGILVVR